jgi:DNA-binding GntR family transcriptional regulator
MINNLTITMKRLRKTVEEVYEEIKKMIYLNLLAPGQKLICQDLAKKLDTSTTPVIQALRGLERSSLVRHDHNRGYFVQEITIREAEELFQAREALESFAVPIIVQNLNRDRLESIRQAIKDYQNAQGSEQRRGLMLKDAGFHLKIMECAGNKVIYGLLEHVLEQITLKYNPEYLWEYRIKEVSKEHREILESLSKGNVAETQELMRSHIRKGRDHVIGSLKAFRKIEI